MYLFYALRFLFLLDLLIWCGRKSNVAGILATTFMHLFTKMFGAEFVFIV